MSRRSPAGWSAAARDTRRLESQSRLRYHSPETLGAGSIEVTGEATQKLSRFRGGQRHTEEKPLRQRAALFLQERLNWKVALGTALITAGALLIAA